jgi:hypothetical protein
VQGSGDRNGAEAAKALSEQIRPEYVKACAEAFTAEELRSILAFFLSPNGQTYITKEHEVSSKTGAADRQAATEELRAK